MEKQHTVAGSAKVSGISLHTGSRATLRIQPAPANSGIVFRRVDLPGRDEIRALAGVSGTTLGTGGMVTKLQAAEICLGCGCEMIIANGDNANVLYDILDGKPVGTRFHTR